MPLLAWMLSFCRRGHFCFTSGFCVRGSYEAFIVFLGVVFVLSLSVACRSLYYYYYLEEFTTRSLFVSAFPPGEASSHHNTKNMGLATHVLPGVVEASWRRSLSMGYHANHALWPRRNVWDGSNSTCVGNIVSIRQHELS
jgi:hypothetical protein